MDKLILKLKNYLRDSFKIEIALDDTDVEISPPIQLRKYCKVMNGLILGKNFNIVFVSNDKILHGDSGFLLNSLIECSHDSPLILVFDNDTLFRTPDGLLRNRIGHIIPDHRCYIPEFLLDVSPKPSIEKPELGSKRLSVLSTLITCRYLEGELPRVFLSSDLDVDVSRAAKSRAVNELIDAGIIKTKKAGRANEITFVHDRSKIWTLKNLMFSDPNTSSFLVPTEYITNFKLPLAGESALSWYTILSKPKIKCYAAKLYEALVIGNDFPKSESQKLQIELDVGVDYTDDVVEVKVYHHLPTVNYSGNKPVLSQLSLLLSSFASREPRVQESINTLSNQVLEDMLVLDQQDK